MKTKIQNNNCMLVLFLIKYDLFLLHITIKEIKTHCSTQYMDFTTIYLTLIYFFYQITCFLTVRKHSYTNQNI